MLIHGIIAAFVAAFAVIVGRLIVRKQLREEYAIIWVIGAIILIVFGVWQKGVDVLAAMLGVYYAPSLLFIGAILGIMIFLLHISVVLTKLQNQNKTLAQEIALLKTNRPDQLRGEKETR